MKIFLFIIINITIISCSTIDTSCIKDHERYLIKEIITMDSTYHIHILDKDSNELVIEKKMVNDDYPSHLDNIIKGRHYCLKLISLPLKIGNTSLRGDVTRYGYKIDGKWVPRLFDSECLFGLKYFECKKDGHLKIISVPKSGIKPLKRK